MTIHYLKQDFQRADGTWRREDGYTLQIARIVELCKEGDTICLPDKDYIPFAEKMLERKKPALVGKVEIIANEGPYLR